MVTPLNDSNVLLLFLKANELSDNWFVPGMQIAVFISLLVIFWAYPKPEGFAAASFISFLLTVILYTMGMTPQFALVLSIAMLGISAVALYLSKE